MWGSVPDRRRSRAHGGLRALPVLLVLALTTVAVPAVVAKSAAKPKCFGAVRTIQGNKAPNTLRGNGARNVIVGLGGNDKIYPGGGADLVCAGPGNDLVSAYDGFADRISCGPGIDRVTADPRDAVSRDCERVTRVNSAPTGILLSKTNVNEGLGRSSLIGVLKSVDKDPNDVGRFALVLGVGGNDNKYFAISGNQLLTNQVFDAETRTDYEIRVRVMDSGGKWIDRVFAITINDVNEAPFAISLTPGTIAENQPLDRSAGVLAATDPDGDPVTFSLVPGVGSADNASFYVSGDELRASVSFDYETMPTRSVRVRATDPGGKSWDQSLTVAVADVNEGPTVAVGTPSVAENQAPGTDVGTAVATDPEGDGIDGPVVLVPGALDNASFTLVGSTLRTTQQFDHETKASYQVRFSAKDDAGEIATTDVTIAVTDGNDAPTDLALAGTTVAENQPSGTSVGTLSRTDVDAGDTATYTLVGGAGSVDNASFAIDGAVLETAASFDVEAKSSYSVRVRVTDQGGLSFEKQFTITVTNVNEAPTNVGLSNASVAENQPSGTSVGTLSASDPDAGGSFTYALVSGAGSTDNASFAIDDTVLETAASFDVEAKSSYSVRVRVTDQGGLSFEKQLTITVTNVNEAPTNIGLSNASVAENQPSGTSVGTLSASDPDAGGSFTYALVSGAGSTDNGSFAIDGAVLETAASFDVEAKSSYSVRVRVTDQGGLSFEKQLTITVTNVNEAPTDITLTGSTVAEDAAVGDTVGTLSATDPDAGDSATFTLVAGDPGDADAFEVTAGGAVKVADGLDFEAQGSYTITVRATDAGGETFDKAVSITVTDVVEP